MRNSSPCYSAISSNNYFSLLVHPLALRLAWIFNEWHDNRHTNLHSRCYPKHLMCSWSCVLVFWMKAPVTLGTLPNACSLQWPSGYLWPFFHVHRSVSLFFSYMLISLIRLFSPPCLRFKKKSGEEPGSGGLEITFTWTLFTAISQTHGLCL